MAQNNKEQWVYTFRNMMTEVNISEASIDDDSLIEVMKAFLAPGICEENNIKYQWQYEIYFNALINYMEPPEQFKDGINLERLKSQINNN